MSIMRIEKEYSRLVSLGNFENFRVGLKASMILKDASAKKIKIVSNKLLKLLKSIVEQEINSLQG